MGSLDEVYLFQISAECFVALLSTLKIKPVMSLVKLHAIRKTGKAASRVLSKIIACKMLEYAYVLN